MKTSTKLLIGLLSVIVIINIYVIVIVRVHLQGAKNGNDLPDYENLTEMESEIRDMDSFNKLYVDFPCHISYSQNGENRISIEAHKRKINKIEYKDINGQLILTLKDSPDRGMINIELSSDSLIDIILNNGARFETDDIKVSSLNISAAEGHFSGIVHTHHLELNVSDNSSVSIEGETDYLNVMEEPGCVLNIEALTVNYR